MRRFFSALVSLLLLSFVFALVIASGSLAAYAAQTAQPKDATALALATQEPARGSPQPILGKGTNYRGFWASAKRLVKSGAQLKLAIDAGLAGALVLNCSLGQIQ
jgi:hypothetical protein